MSFSGDIKINLVDPAGFDIEITDGDFSQDDGILTAILISLFTDRQASTDDPLPGNNSDRRGWWADELFSEPIGSKLWLLERAKLTENNIALFTQYAEDALKWMVNRKLCSKVTITVSRDSSNLEKLNFTIGISRTGKRSTASSQTTSELLYNFNLKWDTMSASLSGSSE